MKAFAKYIGLFLTILGVFILFVSKSSTAEIPLLVGLFTLLVSSEKQEDERSGAIRTSSVFLALVIGYSLKLVITNLHDLKVIGFDLTSINYFLIMVFAMANLIRFWKLYF